MSGTYIPVNLRRLVEKRANYRCEYCQLPAAVTFFPHEIDHVIAQKHGGATNVDNLAFTCWRCNRHKGTDLGSFDPETGAFSFLFNPRTQKWGEHFTFSELDLLGLTPPGRVQQLDCYK
ncbi:HNH endonuclease [Nostoc sp.]|uniref:HNH endonuclease n=1 Tax=Nostoc sp. TaxID=1180 RepID=UPI002FF6662D